MQITEENFTSLNDSDWVNVVDQPDGSWAMAEASGGATDSYRNRMGQFGDKVRTRNGHWANRQRLYDAYRNRGRK